MIFISQHTDHHQPTMTTLSPERAALSILIPINLEQTTDDLSSPSSTPLSLSSVDFQSDGEQDRQVAEKRLSRYYPATPITTTHAVVRPQFSCPDFGMGTAQGFKGRMRELPPV